MDDAWVDVYDASAGVDLDGPTQVHNPFHGDVRAPPAWFALSRTDNVLCSVCSDRVRVHVVEYTPSEAGVLLEAMTKDMQASGTPAAFSSKYVAEGREQYVVEFPRVSPCTNTRCCEMHAVLEYASRTNDAYLQPCLRYRATTSGHLSIADLLRVDPYGDWDDFVAAWETNANDIVARVMHGTPIKTLRKRAVQHIVATDHSSTAYKRK